MLQSHTGELAALLTAFFWTITAVAFESAGKKIGSVTVNLIRLFLALLFLGTYTLFTRGSFFPAGASHHNWIWLSLSGFVGFVLGWVYRRAEVVLLAPRHCLRFGTFYLYPLLLYPFVQATLHSSFSGFIVAAVVQAVLIMAMIMVFVPRLRARPVRYAGVAHV